MRIVMLTSGSMGDLQPYVALGIELKHRGFDVCITGAENYASFVESYGLTFFAITGDIRQYMDKVEQMGQLRANNPIRFLFSFRSMSRAFEEDFLAMQHKIWEICQDADGVVFHPGMVAGFFVSCWLGIPSLMASPIPISATSAFPSMLSYNGPRLGKWYTRMTHRFFQSAFWMASHKPIKRFWKDIDKQPPVRIQNPYPWFEREGFPVLYGFSRHVIPPPDDWGASIQVTGYWIPPVVSGWEPPKALCAFLDAGEAPVYVGFGSIRGAQMQQDMEHAMKALKELGHRVVMTSSAVHPSWNTDASIFVLESAPHRWLFPRMRAVIHHGGAGTTAAGLCAGVPSVVVPYSNDQPMWAQRVQELGVGLKLTSKQRTSSNAWKRVLQEVLEPSVCANAKVLGEKIRAEEGIHEACDAIERLFSGAHETRK